MTPDLKQDTYFFNEKYINKGSFQKEGRTINRYAERIETVTRIWEGLAAFFLTLFTFGSALFFGGVRRMWSESLTGEGRITELFNDTLVNPRGTKNEVRIDASQKILRFKGDGTDSLNSPFNKHLRDENGEPFDWIEGDFNVPVIIEVVDVPLIRTNIPGSVVKKWLKNEEANLIVNGQAIKFPFKDKGEQVAEMEKKSLANEPQDR